MSQLYGFKYLIKRQGEAGQLGPILDAVQVLDISPLVELLQEKNYYLGSKEEWEEFTGLVAGDLNGDGKHDAEDRKIADSIR